MNKDIISLFINSHLDKKGFNDANNEIDKLKGKAKNTGKDIGNIGTSFASGIKTAAIGLMSKTFSTLSSQIPKLAKQSSDYIETLNVLEVAFQGSSESIREFTSNIADTLNLDDASIIKMSASFKTLANSMQYSNEVGTDFSKLMTQLSLDAASLYNLDLNKAQSMMQYAIQGQGKTLKAMTGASVLESTVQNTLDSLGIDAYVESMNDAEKAMARTIAITYQLRYSQGDLARTIEAPANQFRVMGEQMSQLARNIGNVFLPAIAAILPYINAVLIVLNKIISALATLVGFSESAWDNFDAEDTANSFDNLASSVAGVGSAADSTKKKLNGLRGFDKLNNIKTPTSSGGSGGSGGTGINENLLKAFQDIFANYDSKLDGVKTKASEIAEAIMSSIGKIDFSNLISSLKELKEAFTPLSKNLASGLKWIFEKVLVPIAKWTITDVLPEFIRILANSFKILNNTIEGFKPFGEWLWKSFLSPLAKWTGGTIVSVLKNINSVMSTIAKNKIASMITSTAAAALVLYTNFGKLVTILGKSKLLGAISNLLKPTKTLFEYIGTGTKAYGSLSAGIKEGTNSWRAQMGIVDSTNGKLNGMQGALSGTKIALQSIGTAAVGLTMVSEGAKDAAKEGANLGNVLGTVTGSLTTISSMTTAGAVFGPWGAAIGATVGVLATLAVGMKSASDNADTLTNKLKENTEEMQKLAEQAESTATAEVAKLEHTEKLANELDNLVDSNGRVKKSDEERVNYILKELNDAYGTEYELINGIITQNGKEISSKEELDKQIKKVITTKKAEAVINAYMDEYTEALKQNKEAIKLVSDEEEKYKKKIEDIEKEYKKAMDSGDVFGNASNLRTAKMKAAENEYQDKLKEIDKQYKSSNKLVTELDKLREASASGNLEQMTKYINKFTTSNGKTYDQAVKDAEKTSKEVNKNIEKNYSTMEESAKTSVKNINSTVNNSIKDKTMTVKVKADMSSFNSSINSINNKTLTLGVKKNADGGIYSNGYWQNLQQYAGGGIPSHGSVFVAGEAGAEIVGNIGGKTEVLNKSQIASAIYQGVGNAVKGVMNSSSGGVFNIYLDENHKLGSYTLDQLQSMAKSNGKAITIG